MKYFFFVNISLFKNNLFSVLSGKLITYLRRYSYSSIIGIAQEDDDDDGNEVINKTKKDGITQPQLQQITELIKLTNSDKAKMLSYYKIKNLNDLSEVKAGAIIDTLMKKKINSVPLDIPKTDIDAGF